MTAVPVTVIVLATGIFAAINHITLTHSSPVAHTSSPPPPSPSPSPTSSGPSNTDVANEIASLVVGNDSLSALSGADGTATHANCDPSTVSNPPDVHAPTTASCDITYSDGTTWQQTVTIDFDDSGNPVSASTNLGTQIG